MARVSFEMAQSQVQRPVPRPKTVSRQMPNRDTRPFGRLFHLLFQVSRGQRASYVAETTPQYLRHKIV